MFSVSNCEFLILPGDPALASFTPPSKDLLPVSARSKTLNDFSATGASRSSSTLADDFRRAKAFGNLGMKYSIVVEDCFKNYFKSVNANNSL
jgi:hypothetical protein